MNSSKITDEEITLPNVCYVAGITLIPKLVKKIKRRQNYKSVSLMNIDAKIQSNVLRNQIQQYIKRVMHSD